MSSNRINSSKLFNITLISYFAAFLILISMSQLAGEDDLFWYLSTGRYIVQNGVVPSADVFGFSTSGMPWIPFEWAWDVINFYLFSISGYAALSFLEITLILSIFYLIFRLLLKFNVRYPVSLLVLLLLAIGMIQRMSIKPHLVSYLAFILILTLIIRFRYFERDNPKILYFLPLIFFIWINLHMGVLAGLFMFGLYIVSELTGYIFRKRLQDSEIKPLEKNMLFKLITIFIISAAATLLNPHGLKTYEYAFHIVSMKQLEIIYEWKSPFSTEYLLFFSNFVYYFFILLIIPVIYYSVKKKDIFPVLLAIGFFLQSTRAYRLTIDFMLISAPFAAISLNFILLNFKNEKLKTYLTEKIFLKIVFSITLLFVIANIPNNKIYSWLSYSRKFGIGIDNNNFPVRMYNFLRTNGITETGERPFNTYETGGYFIWNFPDKKNFIGSRGLNDDIWNQYTSIINAEQGFEGKMDMLNIDYVLWMVPLLNYSQNPEMLNFGIMHYLFKDSKKWKLLYWDDRSFLFVRNEAKFENVINLEYKFITPFNFYFRRDIIDKGIIQDNESVKKEIERKKTEDPDGVFLKAILKHYGNRLE